MEDAAHFGIPAEALPEEALTDGIWPQNEAAVLAFLEVSTQWRGSLAVRAASTGRAWTTRPRTRGSRWPGSR